MATVAFRTLGCRLNQADTDAMRTGLSECHHQVVSNTEPADFTIINSCAVTRAAEAKTRGAITAARRVSPKGKIVVTGCYANLSGDELLDIPGVCLMLGNNEKYDLCEFLDSIECGEKIVRISRPGLPANTFRPVIHSSSDKHIRANLKVQEGCDYRCAYCIIPDLRGDPRSRPPEDCVAETNRFADGGGQEIVLTGINLGCYESADGDLSVLIRRLQDSTAIPRIRLSSIEPDLVTLKLIELLAAGGRLCRYLHIPLQHGSDKILALMKRRYQTADYAKLIDRIKSRSPQICLGADVMVGFPGETVTEFNEMYNFIANLNIDYLHVFRYSARPGTPAARLGDHIPDSEKKRRSEILRQLSRQKRSRFMEFMRGQEAAVLIEEQIAPGIWQGLTDNYIKVRINAKENLFNRIRKVRITHVSGDFIKGELLSE